MRHRIGLADNRTDANVIERTENGRTVEHRQHNNPQRATQSRDERCSTALMRATRNACSGRTAPQCFLCHLRQLVEPGPQPR
jgi:hypothetical protein